MPTVVAKGRAGDILVVRNEKQQTWLTSLLGWIRTVMSNAGRLESMESRVRACEPMDQSDGHE